MSASVAREVGGYEILAKLKAGGMATLYLGRRKGAAGFSRYVAIKFVHEHLAEDDDFVRMFVNEALLQARITHPNVVHVEELGETPEGQHFLVMEYVHGCSLSQLLRALVKKRRALSPELAVFVAMQVAAGLHAAHEARDDAGAPLGVVHRDVSPDNVLLAYEGHVKLIDFGVAKVESSINKTSTGTLKGKLRYMSPEQASGREIDRRTDVYALGIVLWEMLTMQRLFPEPDQLALLDAVRNPVIAPPSTLRANLPPRLEDAIMRALSPDISARFASTADFRRALAEAVPGALMVEPSQLASLLTVAMAGEIESDRRRLPASVAAALGASREAALPDDEDAALATSTITMEGLAVQDGRSGGTGERSAPSQPSASGARPLAPSPYAAPLVPGPAGSAPFAVPHAPPVPQPPAPTSGLIAEGLIARAPIAPAAIAPAPIAPPIAPAAIVQETSSPMSVPSEVSAPAMGALPWAPPPEISGLGTPLADGYGDDIAPAATPRNVRVIVAALAALGVLGVVAFAIFFWASAPEPEVVVSPLPPRPAATTTVTTPPPPTTETLTPTPPPTTPPPTTTTAEPTTPTEVAHDEAVTHPVTSDTHAGTTASGSRPQDHASRPHTATTTRPSTGGTSMRAARPAGPLATEF